jgi:hypothetical protein
MMEEQPPSPPRSKMKKAKLTRFLVVGLSFILVIILSLGALLYWCPVLTINTFRRGLLKLGGIKSRYIQVGPIAYTLSNRWRRAVASAPAWAPKPGS